MSRDQPLETAAYQRLEQEDLDWTTWEEKAQFYGELKGYAREKKYKPAWAACKFKARFMMWPDERMIRDAPERWCSDLTRVWISATMQGWWRQKRHG